MNDDLSNIDKKFVYTADIPVRWRDLDDFGHVNNSVYLTYFEQARAEWWLSVGIKFKDQATGPILISCQCTFLKPVFFPAELAIKVYVGPPGRSSYMIYYEICDKKSPEVLYADGSTKIVWVNYQQGKSVPLSTEMIAALS